MFRKLALLDRDGVIVVNSARNIKRPSEISLIPGAPEAIRALNEAGYTVAICTNQPEVARGVLTTTALDAIHAALLKTLRDRGAIVDRVFVCTAVAKCPRRKPAGGMLAEALAFYGARASVTPFVGDQVDDLKAGFHAGCLPMLVRTGLGAKTLLGGLPTYVQLHKVCEDLQAAARHIVRQCS